MSAPRPDTLEQSTLVQRLRDWPAGGQDMLSATVVGDLMTEAADTIEALCEALKDGREMATAHRVSRLVPPNEYKAVIAKIDAALAKATA